MELIITVSDNNDIRIEMYEFITENNNTDIYNYNSL